MKATLAGRRVAEVPTTWRDRTAGQSNFKLRKWLPHYLHWYRTAFVGRLRRGRRSRSMIGRMRVAFERIGLPAWFIVIDLLWIAKPDVLGIDARHYQRAASEWLAGGDPWKVTEGGIPFAAGPHTLLFYAPTSVLPLSVSVAVWMVLGVAAAVWMVRRLDIPIWWIAFPPLAHALWNGNPQSIVLALLVAGGTIAAIAAVGLKLYAAVPLVFRPRQLALVIVALVVVAAAPAVAALHHRRLRRVQPPLERLERQRLAHPDPDPADPARPVDPPPQGRGVVRRSGGLAGDAVLLRLDGDAGRHLDAPGGRRARPAPAA